MKINLFAFAFFNILSVYFTKIHNFWYNEDHV